MSSPEEYTSLPTYFAPKAFEIMRAGGTEVSYNLYQMNRILREAEFIINQTFLPVDQETAIVYRFGVPGPFTPKDDPNFHKSHSGIPYITHDRLELSPTTVVEPNTTRGEITTWHPHILQIQMQDLKRPMAWWLADSLVFPPSEEQRIFVMGGAWKRHRELEHAASSSKRTKFKEEMAEKFAGAIIMSGQGGSGDLVRA